MREYLSIYISIVALIISSATAWFTLLYRGRIKMTQPTVIYFGPDGGRSENSLPKVFFRALLFSTSKRGHVIENMFIRLRRGENRQTFNIWVYGDKDLARGSGVYIGPEGLACNHHFLLPSDGTGYDFLSGDYVLEVFVNILGHSKANLLFSIKLMLNEQQSVALKNKNTGLYFDYGPDSQRYHVHIDTRPPKPDISFLPSLFSTMDKIEKDKDQ